MWEISSAFSDSLNNYFSLLQIFLHVLVILKTSSAVGPPPNTLSLAQCQDSAELQIREFKETLRQVEEDEEKIINKIQIDYERKLHSEKESNLNLKGEAGVLSQKVPRALTAFLCLCIQPTDLCHDTVVTVLLHAETTGWQKLRHAQTEAGAAEVSGADSLPGERHWRSEETDLWTGEDQPGQGDPGRIVVLEVNHCFFVV